MRLLEEGLSFYLMERLDRLSTSSPPKLRLAPLEKRLYVEVIAKLPPDAAAAVERQMHQGNPPAVRPHLNCWTAIEALSP